MRISISTDIIHPIIRHPSPAWPRKLNSADSTFVGALSCGHGPPAKSAIAQNQHPQQLWQPLPALEVSFREQNFAVIYAVLIDAVGTSRYSQAQIKDLVAYANPRSHKVVKSSGSRPPCVSENLLVSVATSLSLRPPSFSSLTTASLYKTLPGGSHHDPARLISPLNRLPGGYRLF